MCMTVCSQVHIHVCVYAHKHTEGCWNLGSAVLITCESKYGLGFLLLDVTDVGMKGGCSLKEFILVINCKKAGCRWN